MYTDAIMEAHKKHKNKTQIVQMVKTNLHSKSTPTSDIYMLTRYQWMRTKIDKVEL